MTTTAITQHDLPACLTTSLTSGKTVNQASSTAYKWKLKTQVGAQGIWPAAWDRGQWVEREDTMVFLVEGKARVRMPKEDFEPFVKAKTRHR